MCGSGISSLKRLETVRSRGNALRVTVMNVFVAPRYYSIQCPESPCVNGASETKPRCLSASVSQPTEFYSFQNTIALNNAAVPAPSCSPKAVKPRPRFLIFAGHRALTGRSAGGKKDHARDQWLSTFLRRSRRRRSGRCSTVLTLKPFAEQSLARWASADPQTFGRPK